jgi:hypothetical protein
MKVGPPSFLSKEIQPTLLDADEFALSKYEMLSTTGLFFGTVASIECFLMRR